MASKGKRRMMWALIVVVVIAAAGFLALQYAISQNGPAVLDKVDRLTGGSRDVELVKKVSLGDSAFQKLAVYNAVGTAGEAGAKPVILFTHGGSWRDGSPDDYGFVARSLADRGFVVILTGYRLGDPGKFPAMLEDTAKAVAWTKANISEFGGNPDQIFLSGHSAGAYNAVMIALDRQWLGREGLDSTAIKGVIGLAGPYDFYPFDSDSTRASFGEAPVPEDTQPINFVRGDAPPLLLLTGEKDTTVMPRNTRVLAKAITAAGGIAETGYFDDFDHTGIILALASPWNRDSALVDQISDFVARFAEAPKIVSNAAANNTEGGASVPVQAKNR